KTPTDASANEIVGRYYCLGKGDWSTGLPLLVQGKDASLKALAEKDTANPATPQAQTELADAWYEYGNALDPACVPQARLRALFWYEQAVAGLNGISKIKVEKRISELEMVTEIYGDHAVLFHALREAVRARRYAEDEIRGVPSDRFLEVPAEGGLL